MSELPDLTADPHALQVRKRPVPVQATFAATEGICETLEGPVRYRGGDAILTGSLEEHWPMSRDSFLEGYEAIPPTVSGEDGTYRKRPGLVFALRLDHKLQVPAGWQHDPLQGHPDDWLLRYADGSHGVANDAIFRETYESTEQEHRWPPSE